MSGAMLTTLRDVDGLVEAAIQALRRLPYRTYLRTAHWQRVRALALERAGHQCELCSSTQSLEVHHRSYARLGFERPDDVIALCAECHREHHRALVLRTIRATERAQGAVTVAEVLEKAG